jgi:hypothetical protein
MQLDENIEQFNLSEARKTDFNPPPAEDFIGDLYCPWPPDWFLIAALLLGIVIIAGIVGIGAWLLTKYF